MKLFSIPLCDKGAEDLVKLYANELLPGAPYLLVKRQPEGVYITGADFSAWSLSRQCNIDIEVKRQEGFLTQDNNDQGRTYLEPSGTLRFEIFSGLDDMGKREEAYPGWLPAFMDPIVYDGVREDRRQKKLAEGKKVSRVTATSPGVLAILLVDHDGNPFACIAFDKLSALCNRLIELCPDPEGWGIGYKTGLDGMRPATDKDYWDQYMKYYIPDIGKYHNINWNKTYGGMYEGDWYVPFEQLADLATVTMINKDPDPAHLKQQADEYAAEQKEKNGYGAAKNYCKPIIIRQRLTSLTTEAVRRGAAGRMIRDFSEKEQEWIMSHNVNEEQLNGLYGDPVKVKSFLEEYNRQVLSKDTATGVKPLDYMAMASEEMKAAWAQLEDNQDNE